MMMQKAVILTGASMLAFTAQPACAATYLLKFFQVDDEMSAHITNSAFTDQLVLQHSFGADYPYVDITPFVANGLNTLTLSLINGPAGYTYGYDFLIDGISFASGACGIFNVTGQGCDADQYGEGLAWTTQIKFNGVIDAVAGVPEPATWAQMIAGFGLLGWSVRRKRRPAATIPSFA